MRTNTFVGDKLTSEMARRQNIFSSFMESFNTGIALPPVMAKMHNRITAIEEKLNLSKESAPRSVPEPVKPAPVKESVEDLIETVPEPIVTRKDFELKTEATVKEFTAKVTALEKLVNEKLKKVELLNATINQLNKTMEETINRVHSLEKRSTAPSAEISGDFATKQELKDTEKRIVKELTDKIDAEMIDAEDRFNEKIKASMETLKLAIEETVGDDEEEDAEEDNEEEDIEGVIDTD